MKRLLFVCLAAVGAVVIGHAQTPLDPAKLLNPGTDTWPSYNGDYSGRRFSTLTKINDKNVGALSLAWVYRVNLSDKEGTTIKGTPVVIDGVMYLTVPDHVWAIDARTGRQLWHHAWTSKGGIHIGNRGVGRARRRAVLRDAGLQAGLAEHQGRLRALAQADLRPGAVLLRVGRADRREEPHHRRRERRRS